MSPERFDHEIVFLITVTLGVVGMIAVFSWIFLALGWNGPLAVLKGGMVPASKGVAPQ